MNEKENEKNILKIPILWTIYVPMKKHGKVVEK